MGAQRTRDGLETEDTECHSDVVLVLDFSGAGRRNSVLGRALRLLGTGHSAVYLSQVCATSPVVLRLCAPGETGIVLSRYRGVAGYDWVAIPLVPYLYAVEKEEDVPLFADAKLVAFLRDRYRRTHLESLAPDLPNAGTPAGGWRELTGAAYIRTIYALRLRPARSRMPC
jgi:hypothetical protein